VLFGVFLGGGEFFGRFRGGDFCGGAVFVVGFLTGLALFAFGFFELRFGYVFGQRSGFLFG
jgi:hypothetical protein